MVTRNCVQLVRKRRHLSVKQLAERVGVSRQTIYSLERDPSYTPKSGFMFALARALNTEVSSLFWEEPERIAEAAV